MASLWTPEEDSIIIDMVNDNKTVNDISAFLNKTTSSVHGRIRRMREAGKLTASPSVTVRVKKPKVAKEKKPTVAKEKKPTVVKTVAKERKAKKPPEPKVIDPETLHPLERLGSRDCRWPFGDPRRKGFRFCGQKIENGNGPYCREHAQKAFSSTYKSTSATPAPELEPA